MRWLLSFTSRPFRLALTADACFPRFPQAWFLLKSGSSIPRCFEVPGTQWAKFSTSTEKQ